MRKQAQQETKLVGPNGVEVREMSANYDFLQTCQIWLGGPGTGKTSTASALGKVAKKMGIPGVRPFFLWFESGVTNVPAEGTTEKCHVCNGSGKDGKSTCSRCGGEGILPLILSAVDGDDPMKLIFSWFEWAANSVYNPLVIDTGNAYFLAITEAVCKKNGVPSPSKANDNGVTWLDIFNTVRSCHGILRASNKTLIYIMHEYERTKRTRGGEITEMVSHVSGASDAFLKGATTQIMHFDISPSLKDEEPDKAVIHCNPYAGIEAKDRWGILPDELDRGTSPEEGAEAILRAFYKVE